MPGRNGLRVADHMSPITLRAMGSIAPSLVIRTSVPVRVFSVTGEFEIDDAAAALDRNERLEAGHRTSRPTNCNPDRNGCVLYGFSGNCLTWHFGSVTISAVRRRWPAFPDFLWAFAGATRMSLNRASIPKRLAQVLCV
jgi:hypothetical protein